MDNRHGNNMKHKILIYGRYAIAIMFLVLCGLAFFKHIYPLKIFDVQFTASLQSGIVSGVGIGFILFVALIVITLLFGRVYCGAFCPLGLYQEFLSVLFKPFHRKGKFIVMKHYVFAYFFAAILFGLLFGGTVVVLRLFDPYAIFGNALSGAAFGLGFAVFLALLVFFKKRFFCTNICPVGAILGFISRFSLLKIRIDTEKCKICSLCAGSCPCGSIDFKNHTVHNETCIKCFKCLGSCQHGALYYGLPKKKMVEFSPKRRQLLTAGMVVVLFGAAFKCGIKLSETVASKVKKLILPAGSGNSKDFINRCLNCNLCVQNCPMKIIKPATKDIPVVHLDYKRGGYCSYKCHKCSEVCPSGAIKRISLKEKQNTKIAIATVHEDICIQCGVCAFECPKKIIKKDKGKFPIIRFEQCIGCGKCASVCPVKAIEIEPLDKQITLK